MARIPRAQELGLGNSEAQQTRGVVDIPVVDNSGARAVAGAVDKAGQALVDFSLRLQKTVIDRSVAEANIGLADDLDKLNRRLSESPDDPKTYEATYAEESGKIVSAWAQKVPGGGRDMWMARAKEEQLRGTFAVRSLTRTRQLEGEKAKGIALFESITDSAGDPSITAETYAKRNEQGRQLIADQVATGIITKDDAETYYAKLHDAQVLDNTTRFAANIDSLVQEGRVAEAEALFQTQMGLNSQGANPVDPKTLSQVKSGLQSAKQDFAVVEQGDAIWTQAKGDYGKAITAAGKIKDSALRLKVEDRLAKMAQQAKAADEVQQDKYQKALWDHVVGGGTIMNASPALRAAIDPGRMSAIRAYESARDEEAGLTASSKEAWKDRSADTKASLEWMSRSNPSQFMTGYGSWDADTQKDFAAMTPDDQRAIEVKRLEMIQTGQSADAADKVMQDAMNEMKRFAPDLVDPKKNADGVRRIEGILYANARAFALQQGGNAISPEDARKLVLQSLREYDEKKYGVGANLQLSYMKDPVGSKNMMLALREALGRDPKPSEIKAALEKMGAAQ